MLAQFGTPLPALEEDEIPSKKPVRVEDQIVTDENGKRRFHGAFTGGFSAGFWNTVGSQEGWTPQNFKSSRSEKASKIKQKPTDFMDSEDLGEFGIAPHRIQAREEFSSEKKEFQHGNKRKYDGSLLGGPLFENLIEPAKENIAVRILKRMGWKPGQGVGPRLTRRQKKLAAEKINRERYVMQKYGCELPTDILEAGEEKADQNSADSSDDELEITFAPDDFQIYLATPKTNRFGLGYEGLSHETILSGGDSKKEHINLFSHLEDINATNKKLSIKGQAFGVGAFEEEDDDIYARDDLSRYDFSLGGNRKREKIKKSKDMAKDQMILEGFAAAKESDSVERSKYTVVLPQHYKPRNWAVRRSRFEPLDSEKLANLSLRCDYKIRGLGRHDLNPDERGKILGEPVSMEDSISVKVAIEKPPTGRAYWQEMNKKYQNQKSQNTSLLELITAKADNFTKGGILEGDEEKKIEIEPEVKMENEKVLSEAKRKTESLGSTDGKFKPFAGNSDKQNRYEKFLEANPRTDDEIIIFLSTIQPIHLSEWDREVERKEFIQARKIYKPLEGYMSERFVSETTIQAERQKEEITKPIANDEPAVIVVVRTKSAWKPCSQLCKRYNIAEPFGGAMMDVKEIRKPKLSVFDYLEHSVNKKADFVTPVIIPKKIEKPKAILKSDATITTAAAAAAAAATATATATTTTKLNENQNSSKELTTQETIEVASSNDKMEKNLTPAIVEQQRSLSRFKQSKTELEKRIEESKNKPISEKADLFKAIFEDSDDESEKNDKTNNKSDNTDVIEENVPILPTTSQEIASNLLRNNSPPRGIFAALFAPKTNLENPTKPTLVFASKQDATQETKTKLLETPKITFQPPRKKEKCDNFDQSPADQNAYGPQLPETLKCNLSENSTEIDQKIVKLLSKQQQQQQKLIDEMWIEKNDTGRHGKSSETSTKKLKKSKKSKDKIKNNKVKKHKKTNKKKRNKEKK